MNVELAAPDDFIPPLPDWRLRSLHVAQCGLVDFFHYDFYAQALAKLERAHEQDWHDVRAMHQRGLVDARQLTALFDAIHSELPRYPAIDPSSFAQRVRLATGAMDGDPWP